MNLYQHVFLRFITAQKIYGFLLIAGLALLSYLLVNLPGVASIGINSLMLAIVLGMLVGNAWQPPVDWTPGIQFAAQRVLRLAIILYGFRISFQQIILLGYSAFFLDLFIVSTTLLLGYWLGKKLLKLESDLALLVSVGAAICGAAAVLALEDILKSDPHKAVTAVATVVLFGTLSMFLYPILQHAGIFALTSEQFGIFAGASIHEVAQVMVAGVNINPETGEMAVIVKMMRVLLLVPVLFLILLISHFKPARTEEKTKITLPWFALMFIFVVVFNSLNLLPVRLVAMINQIDIILLTMAMTAIGLKTTFDKFKKVGWRPIYLAFFLFIWLMGSGYFWVQRI